MPFSDTIINAVWDKRRSHPTRHNRGYGVYGAKIDKAA